MTSQVAELDAKIAKLWPKKWAKANAPRPGASKRRNRLRRAYRTYAEYVEWRANNPDAYCSNCVHFEDAPMLPNHKHCSIKSDFYGYAVVPATHVCMDHKPNSEVP